MACQKRGNGFRHRFCLATDLSAAQVKRAYARMLGSSPVIDCGSALIADNTLVAATGARLAARGAAARKAKTVCKSGPGT
jgi:hypothetical protein